MIKLWGRRNSVNVLPVTWTLAELGLDYERVAVGGHFGGLNTPEYKAINPAQTIPAFEDKGEDGHLAMGQSNAIVRYLARRYGKHLIPSDSKEEALADSWMDWQKTVLLPAIINLILKSLRLPRAEHDPQAIAQAVAGLTPALSAINSRLEGRDFVVGSQLSVADLVIAPSLQRISDMQKQLEIAGGNFPAIDSYLEPLRKRPAFIETVMFEFGRDRESFLAFEAQDPAA